MVGTLLTQEPLLVRLYSPIAIVRIGTRQLTADASGVHCAGPAPIITVATHDVAGRGGIELVAAIHGAL